MRASTLRPPRSIATPTFTRTLRTTQPFSFTSLRGLLGTGGDSGARLAGGLSTNSSQSSRAPRAGSPTTTTATAAATGGAGARTPPPLPPPPPPPQHAAALRAAEDYMLLSRTETLEQVFPLLAPDASYRSDALGSSWEGREAIRGMMEGFFAKLPDVRWEVRSLAVEPSSAPQGVQGVQGVRVAVEFTRYWTNEEGQAVVATGREWIYVDPAGGPGSIQHVHVAKLDP